MNEASNKHFQNEAAEAESQKEGYPLESLAECPQCSTKTDQSELDMFGGYCEDCATDRLFN